LWWWLAKQDVISISCTIIQVCSISAADVKGVEDCPALIFNGLLLRLSQAAAFWSDYRYNYLQAKASCGVK
jgi:hypothetical protein